MDSSDILQRLIDTEKSSRERVESAQAEIDRRLSEAKRAVEEDKRLKREAAVKLLESELASAKRAAMDEYESLLDGYQASLEARPSDEAAFSALVARLLASDS